MSEGGWGGGGGGGPREGRASLQGFFVLFTEVTNQFVGGLQCGVVGCLSGENQLCIQNGSLIFDVSLKYQNPVLGG